MPCGRSDAKEVYCRSGGDQRAAKRQTDGIEPGGQGFVNCTLGML